MPFAGNVEHRALLDFMAMPCTASRHAAGNVDADERLTSAWVTEHLRQRVCLDVVVHNPLDLGQLQAVCTTELKRQFVFHWPCHALDLLFDGIQALQAMKVIEVCRFVVHHV